MPKSHVGRSDAKSSLTKGLFSGRRAYILALLAYAIIAFAVFYPATTHLLSNVPGKQIDDLYQSVWNVWWPGHAAFALHHSIWDTNLMFWPAGASLIFQTDVPIASLLAYPLTLVSLPLAYNSIFLAGFVLSGLAMMILADYLTKNKYAAFIAGVIFAFSSFHIASAYFNIQYANIEWVPLSVYLFLRIINRDYGKHPKGKYLCALALSASFVLMVFTGDGEQPVMTLVAFLIIVIYYLAVGEHRKSVVSREFASLMALFVVLFLVLGSWAIIPVMGVFSQAGGLAVLGQANSPYNNLEWSVGLASFFVPSYYNGLFNNGLAQYFSYYQDVATSTGYLGYTAIALACLGLYACRKRVTVWLALLLFFLLVSLGSFIQFMGVNTGIPGPYSLLKYVPLVNLIREPGRFGLMVSLALAVLAAYGAKAFYGWMKTRGVTRTLPMVALAVFITLLFLAESSTPPLAAGFASEMTTGVGVSNFFVGLANQPGNFSVLELPIIPDYSFHPGGVYFYPAKAMLTTIYSGKAIIGGYLTRESPQEAYLEYEIPLAVQATELETIGYPSYSSPVNVNFTNQTILLMHLYNISYVTVDKSAFTGHELGPLENYLASVFGNPVYEDNDTAAYSTSNAVARSLYRSFVGYAEPPYWNLTRYDGRNLWLVDGNGTMKVYAPYPKANGTPVGGQVETVVSLTAVSIGYPTGVLEVSENASDGPSEVASFNLTAIPNSYRFRISLSSGWQENRLYFVSGSNHSIGVSNVSFSLAKNGGG